MISATRGPPKLAPNTPLENLDSRFARKFGVKKPFQIKPAARTAAMVCAGV